MFLPATIRGSMKDKKSGKPKSVLKVSRLPYCRNAGDRDLGKSQSITHGPLGSGSLHLGIKPMNPQGEDPQCMEDRMREVAGWGLEG